ncbi:MAG: tol-pal system protein YbgF [Deltaproteobacteria bacterium]|nr:tol-pal system protein YbgF [Deltaproteobacteria bacterium]
MRTPLSSARAGYVRSICTWLAGPILAVGCASTGPLEQEMQRMREDFRRMNADLDAMRGKLERVETSVSLLSSRGRSSETVPVAAAKRPRNGSGSFGGGGVPRLPVVRIERSEEEPLGAADDGGAPVEIRLGPSEGPVERLEVDHDVLARPDPVLGNQPVPKVPARAEPKAEKKTPESSLVPEGSAGGSTAKHDYEVALATLREKALPGDARDLFNEFLDNYPGSSLIDNARYWIGECDIAEGKFEAAVEALSKVVSEHPNSPKVPYALLRIGESWIKLGDTEQATTFLRRVTAEHAGSDAAVEANKVLKNLNSGENS